MCLYDPPLTVVTFLTAGACCWAILPQQSGGDFEERLWVRKGVQYVTTLHLYTSVVLTDRNLAINRLDRLTSGMMILPLNSALANTLSQEFVNGEVKKEYVARCKGKFPE